MVDEKHKDTLHRFPLPNSIKAMEGRKIRFSIQHDPARRRRTLPEFAADDAATQREPTEQEWAEARELKERGCTLAEAGRFADALDLWEKAIALTPSTPELHELMAQGFLKVARAGEAAEAARRAIELHEGWGEAHLALGRALLELRDPRVAEEELERAVSLGAGEEAEKDLNRAKIERQREEQARRPQPSSPGGSGDEDDLPDSDH